MTNLVPADQIEDIVGARRNPTFHLGRAVSAEQQVYILHPQACLNVGDDLYGCPWSLALDMGIRMNAWAGMEDRVVELDFDRTYGLVPRPWPEGTARA